MNSRTFFRFSALLVALSFAGGTAPSWAATLAVPRDYPTINDALAAAVAGDTVVLYGGTYSAAAGETLPIVLRDGVAIRGMGKYSTILDGSGSGQSVFVLSGATLTAEIDISGIQIVGGGGSGVDGGAVSLTNNTGASVVLSDCFLRNNTADRGGAVWVASSQARIENCEVRGNTGTLLGGGVGISDATSSVTIVSSTVAGNQSPQGNGGGVAANLGAQLTLLGTQVLSNSAEYGGGLFVDGVLYTGADGGGQGTEIGQNTGTLAIGGIQGVGPSTLNLEQTLIDNNTAPQAAAFRISNSTVTMDRCSIDSNTSPENVAELNYDSVELSNVQVFRNTSTSGGILWLENTSGDVVFSTVAENTASASSLTGAVVINGAPNPPQAILRILDSIIADNQGVGVVERTLTSDPEFRYNLVSGNTGGYYTDEIFFTYTTATAFETMLSNSPQSTGGLRVGSPGFHHAAVDDYRLDAPSDAMDQGIVLASPSGAAHDFDGNTRTAVVNGSAPDLGAYESTAPQLQGPVLFYTQSQAPLVDDDTLMFQFDRPVRLAAPLAPGDFYLPVAGDNVGLVIRSQVDDRNPTHLLVTMRSTYSLTIPGQFSMSALSAGSASGIDLRAGVGTLKVVDAVTGAASLPLGNDPTTNTMAVDIGLVGGPSVSKAFSPQLKTTLSVAPSSYLPLTKLVVFAGSLFNATTLAFSPVSEPRASLSAVRIDLVSGSPLLRYNSPAFLTLQYDPAEYEAWGYKEKDLTLYRLTEVATNVFEFRALDKLYPYSPVHDMTNHTITMQIDDIIPPRPVFPASAEPTEGPYSAIYMILPDAVESGTQSMEPVSSSPTPVSSVVHLTLPEELIESGAVFPNYQDSLSASAIRMKVGPMDFSHELTGSAPRPSRPTSSGAMAFEAEQVGTSLPIPVDSVVGPADILLQLSDGINVPLPLDFRSWDGTPVSGPQMQLYEFDTFKRTWAQLASGSTYYDPATRLLESIGITPVIPSGGVGLYAAAGDPDLPMDLSFSQSANGWTSGDAAPQLPGIDGTMDGGLLKLTGTSSQGYGWWGAYPGTFYPARDRLYELTYQVLTDAPYTTMPGFRFRINSGDQERLATYGVFGAGTGKAAPAPLTPTNYTVLFQPSGHSIDAALAGNASESSFVPFFEYLNFLPGKDETAWIGLADLGIRPLDPTTFGPWTRRATYDFAGTASALGWKIFGDTNSYHLSASSSGLTMTGGLLNSFAGVGVPGTFVIQTGQLYRVRYRIRSDSEPSVVPSFRLRVNDSGFETFAAVRVESAGNGEESPSYKFRDYDVYYYPPQVLASAGTVKIGFSFDYIDFNPYDRVNTAFTLESVVVDSAPWSP